MPHDDSGSQSGDSAGEYRAADAFDVQAQGHRFTFYPGGADRLEALVKHIASARRSLQLYYYLFEDDASGHRVRDALIEALTRGVSVHLIVDHFGTDAPREFFEPIIAAGGRYAVFAPRRNVRYLIRNHQKFAIADGRRVMTGGSNISDHYFSGPEENGWCDLTVAIEGDVAGQFEAWFALIADWIESDGSQLRKLRRMISKWDAGEGAVQLLVGGPSVRLYGWARRFRSDLKRATRFDSVSAYFTPQRSIVRMISKVARRGQVRMVTAGKSDIDATIAAARLLYRPLLKAGAQIAEFRPSKLHMKLMVIDDASYFGSANLDKRSIRINVELMVRVQDAELAGRLRELIDHVERASQPVTPEWYAEKSRFPARLRWRGAYLLAVFDYWLTRRLNR
ncbi:MAG: phosphatidylserine/phosphatidylglycerophosphate/cardiolipin synthase family protein [Erythrobacter sp.]